MPLIFHDGEYLNIWNWHDPTVWNGSPMGPTFRGASWLASKAHPLHKQYQPKPGFMNINSNGIIIIKIAQAKPILVT